MKNGNEKISDRDLKMSRFLHRGKWHFSYNGRFIECAVLDDMRGMKIADDKIFKEFGKSFEECRVEHEAEREKTYHYPEIDNWQQLLDYMLSVMKKEMAVRIKRGMSENMGARDIIPLLPEPFQPIFRLRLDYDEKIRAKKQRTIDYLKNKREDEGNEKKKY